MKLAYADICAGISAATAAWRPLGWQTAFYSEIEKFPSAVLAHHYPYTPNYGDMTRFADWPDASLDVLIGGTPCQGFSIAGLRKGLDDPRSNLALCFGLIAKCYQPRWLVWENVPGARFLNEGRDLGAFLRGLAELGYGLCWRSFDAQYAGLAQRRERLFVVGYLGDWRRAAAVLLEPEGLRWDSPPRREAREGVAPTISARTEGGGGLGTDFDCDGGLVAFGGNNCSGPIDVSTALQAHGGPHDRIDFGSETFIAFSSKDHGADAGALSPTLRAMGHDGSHPNAGGQVAIAFAHQQGGSIDLHTADDVVLTVQRSQGQAVAFAQNQLGEVRTADTIGTLSTNSNASGRATPMVATQWAVRRLTPRECERLMGFPDDFTRIPWRGKPAEQCPDGPRYKALGNSIAVPELRWIGERIMLCKSIVQSQRLAA